MVNGNLAHKFVKSPESEIKIDEMPVKWCTVSLSEIVKRGKRLEASVYDVEAKQAHEIIIEGKYPITMLGGEKGLILVQDLNEFGLKNQNIPFISHQL